MHGEAGPCVLSSLFESPGLHTKPGMKEVLNKYLLIELMDGFHFPRETLTPVSFSWTTMFFRSTLIRSRDQQLESVIPLTIPGCPEQGQKHCRVLIDCNMLLCFHFMLRHDN